MMTRVDPAAIRRVACVGTGTIGAGWVAYFLSRGLEVWATDVAVDAKKSLRETVRRVWPLLQQLGLGEGADPGRCRFTDSVEEAVSAAEFIQESVPEQEDLKTELLARIDAAAPSESPVASSSSQFLPTRLAARCRHPNRCFVGHPFAPSYLMPLVEVVGGENTDPRVLDWAVGFYTHIGKRALRLRREIDWYVANRLQRVVLRETRQLVEQGVCTFRDIDTAMTFGPGLRWAFAGPMLCYHLGGGRGGIRHMIEHFGWDGTPELERAMVEEVGAAAGHLSMAELERWRDDNLVAIMEVLKALPGA